MKKTYVKPQLYFESFQLSANIAGGCGDSYKNNPNVTTSNINTCGYNYAGKILFLEGPICIRQPQDDEPICYHNPSEEQMIFAS